MVLMTLVACIEEFELSDDGTRVLVVDGGVAIGPGRQQVEVGLSNGLADRFTSLQNIDVWVDDLTTGEVYRFSYLPDTGYVAAFTGEYGHVYRLRVDAGVYGSFTSTPDSLAAASFALNVTTDVQRRADRDGNNQARNFMVSRVTLTTLQGSTEAEILLLQPGFAWSYTDLICGPFDIAQTCYFEDRPVTQPFVLVELDQLERGDTASFSIGAQFIDFRMAESSVSIVEGTRRSAGAAPYFRAINAAVNQGGSPFTERAQLVVGNMSGSNDDELMYGYFGVYEEINEYAAVDNPDVRSRSGPPLCNGAVRQGQTYNCCDCGSVEGAMPVRPSYWP